MHIGHLYRFAVTLHEILGEEQNEGKAVVLYSRTNPRDRANTACILCCYMVLIQAWPPHLALAPIAQADPPFMPFRDAGYAPADFILTIQDVVYGVWRAKEHKLIDIRNFNLEEYELYERVDQGDFNEIPPHFVAFASPQQDLDETQLNYPFQQVLDYFVRNDVKLVVRLNSHLYDSEEFETRGIKHVDLVFEDGTCPTMEYVQAFIGAVEGVIAQKGKVAVHCKAGLGRTGCLIGAHLIYTYGFTAAEVIAYMRFLRPGMVVGPQQHWLYLHQNEFREWKRTMTVSRSSSEKLAGFCPLVPRTSVQARTNNRRSPPRTPERSVLTEVDHTNSALPVPTPGQPRKYSPTPSGRHQPSPMAKRYVPSTIGQINSDDEEEEDEMNGGLPLKQVIYDDNNAEEDSTINVEKRSASRTSTPGVLRSRSRRLVTPSGSPERRKPSALIAEVFNDLPSSPTEAGENDENVISLPRVRQRNMTDNLSQKQQIMMRKQLRSTSNPSTRGISRSPSFQMVTTTTTTTLTSVGGGLASSPPTSEARRPNRVLSGVRKPSSTVLPRGVKR